ncbi:hypothetical protein BHE74_00032883 [Ensete ventricosum]|nr:hypothetical protein BHE74_00032883 [Ensete ventricosum]
MSSGRPVPTSRTRPHAVRPHLPTHASPQTALGQAPVGAHLFSVHVASRPRLGHPSYFYLPRSCLVYRSSLSLSTRLLPKDPIPPPQFFCSDTPNSEKNRRIVEELLLLLGDAIMPATDFQGSSVPFASIGRSLLSIRRDQVHAVDGHHHDSPGGGAAHDLELEVFQKHVADLFVDLASSPPAAAAADELLSLAWVRRLLDSFLICQEEFRVILFSCSKGQRVLLARPPLDRLLSDFFDRAVKALDVCNAVRDGVDQLRLWRQHLEIALAALNGGRPLGEGQLRRARKALTDLTILILDEKETAGGSILNHRNRSFGRSSKETHHRRTGSGGAAASAGHFRSSSWSVSRSWSAARQLQAIGNSLAVPRGNEVSATNGLAFPVFTMSSVLFFVMWALVAAIPCQDRGLQTHFSVPRNLPWAASITSLHERIFEESKKKDRKNSCGLLKEIQQIEKCSRHLAELLDPVEFPLTEEKDMELKQGVEELVEVCNALKEGLDPLECQVREVFLRIVRSRTEVLECLSKSHNPE